MDLALREALSRAGVNQETAGLSAFGTDFGSAETIRLGRLANENPPRLRIVDATGTRNDFVEFHPAYHALMQKSMAAGLHCPASAPMSQPEAKSANAPHGSISRLRSKPGIFVQPP